MSKTSVLSGDAHWLPVRSRRTHAAHELTTCRVVYWPAENEYVDLGECDRCGHQIAIDRSGRTTFLVCDATAEPPVVELKKKVSKKVEAANTPIRGIMTPNVECVKPDLPIVDVLALFIDQNVSGVPVLNDKGCPRGVVSKSDVIWALGDAIKREGGELVVPLNQGVPVEATGELGPALGRLTAGDVMTPVVFALPETASIARAAAIMTFEGVHRVPVVSPLNEVVGLVSTLDITRWVAANSGYILPSDSDWT